MRATKRTMVWAGAGVLALVTAGAASAATVNARQRHEAARIQQGLRSGELTCREASRLRAEQAAIRAEERYYRRDGVLGPRERADLRRDLNRASRDIRRQKHD